MRNKAAVIAVCTVAAVTALAVATVEVHHRLRFGHFVGYGIHADVLESSGGIGVPGVKTLYSARVSNYTFFPVKLVGWEYRSDFLGLPPSFGCRFQIQKFSPQDGRWTVAMDFKPTSTSRFPVVIRKIYPFGSIVPMGRLPAAVDSLRIGDLVRFAVFTNFNASDADVYSQPFRIKEVRTMMPSPAR